MGMGEHPIVEQILDLARWAPSGDNTQPWRFRILSDHALVVVGHDTREHCVYDLDGRPSQIAIGGMLETLRLAATVHGLRTEVQRRSESPEIAPVFDVRLVPDNSIRPSPLVPHIQSRTVQRRPMGMRRLTQAEKEALVESAGPSYPVRWIDGPRKWQVARVMWRNAELRLRIPEAFEVHRSVIEWNAQFSEDRIPDRAVGLDPIGIRLMRWAMRSWGRMDLMNRCGGTVLPRFQLDVVPAIACSAHFGIVAVVEPTTIDDYVAAGRAMQRFWLTAAQLGLQVQPEMTPLIFARYARENRTFSVSPVAAPLARTVLEQLTALVASVQSGRVVFLGRIGPARPTRSRSIRLPLEKLLLGPAG